MELRLKSIQCKQEVCKAGKDDKIAMGFPAGAARTEKRIRRARVQQLYPFQTRPLFHEHSPRARIIKRRQEPSDSDDGSNFKQDSK